MKENRGWKIVVFILLLGLIITACGGSTDVEPTPATTEEMSVTDDSEETASVEEEDSTVEESAEEDEKTLVVALFGSPSDLDPASAYDASSVNILRNVYDPLLILEGASVDEYRDMLATEWSVNDDGTVWTMKIREGAQFIDGTPVNAETVRASFARTMDLGLATSWIYFQFMDSSDDIVAVDDYTLEFNLNHPSPVFLQALSSDYGSWVVSPTAVEEHDQGDGAHEWFTTHAAGSGPYILDEFKPEDRVVLTQNPDYWGGWEGDHVEKVIVLTVPESTTRRQLIERGDVDIAAGFSVEDIEAMRSNPELVIHEDYGTRVLQIVFTLKDTLEDPTVRQAYSYAFDYDAFINDLMQGHARPMQGPVARQIEGHDDDLFQYPTDLEMAKDLLEEASVPEGTEYTLWYQEGDVPSQLAAQVLQAQMAQLGMNLKIEEKAVSAFFSTYYGSDPVEQRPDFFVYYWWPDYNDIADWLFVQYHSSTAGAGGNGGFYHNDRVDEILDEAYFVDEEQRLELYQEVQQLLTVDDPAAIWVAEMPESVVVRQDVDGYVLNPIYIGTFDFYNISKE